jgi:hypothetical protein
MGRIPPAQVPLSGDRLGLDSFITRRLCSSFLPPWFLIKLVRGRFVLHSAQKIKVVSWCLGTCWFRFWV